MVVTPDEAIRLLELNLSEEATEESLKKQFKKMVLKYHPDKGGKTEDFLKIKEAYEIAKKYIEQRDRPAVIFPGNFFYGNNDFTVSSTGMSWTFTFG